MHIYLFMWYMHQIALIFLFFFRFSRQSLPTGQFDQEVGLHAALLFFSLEKSSIHPQNCLEWHFYSKVIGYVYPKLVNIFSLAIYILRRLSFLEIE